MCEGPRLLALLGGIALAGMTTAQAQEREVPKDSTRITVAGCAEGRTFIVGERSETEPVRSDVGPGRRLRLSAKKAELREMKLRERTMIEITGLVRTAQVSGPGGISLLGGRLRLGGSPVTTNTRAVIGYNEAVIDVESWRPLPDVCPGR